MVAVPGAISTLDPRLSLGPIDPLSQPRVFRTEPLGSLPLGQRGT